MSANDSPNEHEPYADPIAHSHFDDEQMDEFLRSINMQNTASDAMFAMPVNSTTSSHPVQIPLPDPPVIVPSQPAPTIENQPIYLQNAYPEPPSPPRHEYGELDYVLVPWQQQHQQSSGGIQSSIPNIAHSDDHNWQPPHLHPALRRTSGEYPSPYYQTTPSPAADLSPLPLTPGGVSRSNTSRAHRAAHAAPYDLSARRVSASSQRIAEDVMGPPHRTPSPTRMPPPIAVPQRSEPMNTRKRSRAGTGEDTASSTPSRYKKAARSDQTQIASSSSSSGSTQGKRPAPLQISPSSTTSPTIPSYASHSPIYSSPLASAPVILPPQPKSPTTVPQRDPSLNPPPADSGVKAQSSGSSTAAGSLLLTSTQPPSSVTTNFSSLSSSSSSISAVPSSLSSSMSGSTSSSSASRTIPIEGRRAPEQVHARPQVQSQRSQLRQLTPAVTPSRRAAPYPQSAGARFAYQQATKSSRATHLKQLTSLNFLSAEALLPSSNPQIRHVSHAPQHPLSPWLSSDINTAEHIPADMRYDENSHILSAVLAVPGLEEDKIAVTLEDVHFSRNRVLYISAFTASTFPWHDDDVRMTQHSELVGDLADAEEERENRKTVRQEGGPRGPLSSDGSQPQGAEVSSETSSAQAHDAPENVSSTFKVDSNTQPPTSTTPANQPIRMGYMPNIRELTYGRQVRVINVPPSTQPKDVTATLSRGLLYINVNMGEPLTRETAFRNNIPIACSD